MYEKVRDEGYLTDRNRLTQSGHIYIIYLSGVFQVRLVTGRIGLQLHKMKHSTRNLTK